MKSRSRRRQFPLRIGLGMGVFVLLVLVLRDRYPLGVDWQYNFYPIPFMWQTPYAHPAFTSPPWLVGFLLHAFLGLETSNAVNFLLNLTIIGLVIYRFRGGMLALALTFTSPLMFDLARTNNIDWVPALAFLLPAWLGIPVLFTKPQVLGGAALVWWKRSGHSLKLFLPLGVLVALSFVVWGWWPAQAGLAFGSLPWNFSPFPFFVPLGLYLLWLGYRRDDEILAAAATPFLVPYFAPYSLTPLMGLLASKYRREAIYLYLGFWAFFIVELRRTSILFNGG